MMAASARPRAAGELTASETLLNTGFTYAGREYGSLSGFCHAHGLDPWALPRAIALTGGQEGRTPAGMAALLLKGGKNG